MKKTFKRFLTESQHLPHWPKNKEELIVAYQKIMIEEETGEVMMPIFYDDEHPSDSMIGQNTMFGQKPKVIFNDDLTISIAQHHHGRVQIHRWMLVDGQLPFPFKDVGIEFSVEKGCQLKSLAGVPRKCVSFCVWYDGLADGVTDFIGGPEEVEESYIIQLCPSIKSSAGLPKSLSGAKLELACVNLQDFSYLPNDLDALVLGHSPHFTEEHLKYLPSHAKEINFTKLPGLTSFHNIHKYVKSVKKIGSFEVKISSSILGLSMISDLEEVDDCFYDVNSDDKDWPSDGIFDLVSKYIVTHEVFDFQEALNDLGLTELAKL